ncbi:MAG: energy-coupling factor transporter transmembrane component T [Gemmatimonadota bacterium]|nr:energy-coupling factor transporter transmembrane component T [Gemmatimonadota bacterium]
MFSLSVPDDNLLSRLHPLIKIILLVTTAVFAFSVSSLLYLGLYLGILLLALRVFQIRFGRAGRIIRLFILGLPMLIAVFVLSYLWSEETYVAGIVLGVHQGSLYALRFITLILANFMIVLSTDPRDFLHALKAVKTPETISQIIAHVINFLPRLCREIRTIVEAQELRGMRWSSMWRPSSWMPVTIPMILAAMRYSEQCAVSLELRHGLEKSDYRLPHLAPADWVVGTACVLIIILSIAQYEFQPAIQVVEALLRSHVERYV